MVMVAEKRELPQPIQGLTPRWTQLRHHAEQARLWHSPARRCVVPAGRRSGKTELAKRKLVLVAILCGIPGGGRFIAAAPTNEQAIALFWADLKAMVPQDCLAIDERGRPIRPSETMHTITLRTGTQIIVCGLDKAQRLEGSPIDGIVIDEFADVKDGAWELHIKPALDTEGREGWAWLIGVPEGIGNYQTMFLEARTGKKPGWDGFTWPSSDILPPETIEAAKREMDELSYKQEYEASFLNFQGRAYHAFDRAHHQFDAVYSPRHHLHFCFDFNTAPGVAVVLQVLPKPPKLGPAYADPLVCVLGEVYIPSGSNTPKVCRRLIADWVNVHKEGTIGLYGDSTGGSVKTTSTEGSDWDIIQKELANGFGAGRAQMRVPRRNGSERARVNAVNNLFMSTTGRIGCVISSDARHLLQDLDSTTVVKGGSGELDKERDKGKWTHSSDALGYFIVAEYPTTERGMRVESY